MYYTYVLYSESLRKFYVGYTKDLNKRFDEHISGKSNFTRKASDWNLVKFFEFEKKSDAIILEGKIKKRGCKRFLENQEVRSWR